MRKILNSILPYLISALLLAMALEAANLILGPSIAPTPLKVLGRLWELCLSGELMRELFTTIKRGILGVLLANVAGLLLGILAGKVNFLLRLTAPLVSGIQSCPPIVWISLVMVWAGTGSAVPVVTVFAATVPFVFSNVAQGVMGLPVRIIEMGRLYDVPTFRTLRMVVIPGILPYYLAGLSTVLATAWKAAAVAEFMGSSDGAGAKIYWSYANLNMEDLNVWALGLIILGLGLEALAVTPLRKKAAKMAARGEANL